MNTILNNKNKINPWFITGLTDGDGNFGVNLTKNKYGLKWGVTLRFSIIAQINPPNYIMLNKINDYFDNLGNINIDNSNNCYRLNFQSLNSCILIKSHFDKYPLMTYKLVNYKIWSSILDLIGKKEHLTESGFLKILGYKKLFYKGVDKKLTKLFTNIPEITKPKYIPDLFLITLDWIAGFISSDGHFAPGFQKASNNITGFRISPSIQISQDGISLPVLKNIVSFLNYGNINKDSWRRTSYTLKIGGIENINKFITSFSKISFHGLKALDYIDFCSIIQIIEKKEHLTKKGMNKIIKISSNMNTKRKFNKVS
jgi:hypothetical protein